MDVAASEFYREGKYDLDFKSPPDAARHISAEELADIYQGFVNNYPGGGLILMMHGSPQCPLITRHVSSVLSSGVHRGPVRSGRLGGLVSSDGAGGDPGGWGRPDGDQP